LLNNTANVREGVLNSLSGVRLPREGLLEDDRRLAICQVWDEGSVMWTKRFSGREDRTGIAAPKDIVPRTVVRSTYFRTKSRDWIFPTFVRTQKIGGCWCGKGSPLGDVVVIVGDNTACYTKRSRSRQLSSVGHIIFEVVRQMFSLSTNRDTLRMIDCCNRTECYAFVPRTLKDWVLYP
jgi:hypothetical protein